MRRGILGSRSKVNSSTSKTSRSNRKLAISGAGISTVQRLSQHKSSYTRALLPRSSVIRWSSRLRLLHGIEHISQMPCVFAITTKPFTTPKAAMGGSAFCGFSAGVAHAIGSKKIPGASQPANKPTLDSQPAPEVESGGLVGFASIMGVTGFAMRAIVFKRQVELGRLLKRPKTPTDNNSDFSVTGFNSFMASASELVAA